jgi:triosephosphate isomerase
MGDPAGSTRRWAICYIPGFVYDQPSAVVRWEERAVRTPLVAGNWKMNLTRLPALRLIDDLLPSIPASGVEVAVCPPLVYLDCVSQTTRGSRLGVGAQNMHFEAQGAFTGEVSPTMLVDLNCRYVILGHSERRHGMGETNEDVNRKLKAALEHGLTPIVCVGELIEQRQAGRTLSIIGEQFTCSFADLTAEQMAACVVAYEPVWAIGTGLTATPEQAEEVHQSLRQMIEERFGQSVAQRVRIQYGGSVTPDNAARLLAQPNIDGALVGGASLTAEKFIPIVLAATQASGH